MCFTGDGGFAMVQSELQCRLVTRPRHPRGGVLRQQPAPHRAETDASAVPSWGTRFEASDIVKLAEAMGCDGERAETPEALASIVSRGTALTRPLVVEAQIESGGNMSRSSGTDDPSTR